MKGPLGHREIGRLLGTQRSRVEQIEYAALMKLREAGLLPGPSVARDRVFVWEEIADAGA